MLDVTWFVRDGLPFDLSVRAFASGGASVARANVALADHGRTFADEALDPPACPSPDGTVPCCSTSGSTQRASYVHDVAQQASATDAIVQDARGVAPDIVLTGDGETWSPRRDLLASDRFAPEFVVEMEEDGRAHLRFGDDVLGSRADLRHGADGDISRRQRRRGQCRRRLDRARGQPPGRHHARSPTRCRPGGTDPEPLDQVRLYAPQAFRVRSARSPRRTMAWPRNGTRRCSAPPPRGAGQAAGTRCS